MTERSERFFRTITRRAESIGPQAHPSKKGNQRNIVEDLGIEGIFGFAKKDLF